MRRTGIKKLLIMKKILIINQAVHNHGDEAAHRGLVRNLSRLGDVQIRVLFCFRGDVSDLEKRNFIPENVSCVEHVHLRSARRITAFSKYSMLLPAGWAWWICRFHKTLSVVEKLIEESDVVISAPGGPDIGIYKNWINLWRIRAALARKKTTAIYSPSIGPWPTRGFWGRLFTFRAKQILRKVHFFSLRDAQSQQQAEDDRIPFHAAIDTAFADQWVDGVEPVEMQGINKPYIVFVPNELTRWHFEFQKYSRDQLMAVYRELLEKLLAKGLHVVMLPQLFGTGNDSDYFHELARGLPETEITIIPDHYNADAQQAIIRRARFVVGARYHSIIFSINAAVPLISLTYEHKMSGTLALLGLSRFDYNLHDVLTGGLQQVIDGLDQNVEGDYESVCAEMRRAQASARKMAKQTFSEFEKRCDLTEDCRKSKVTIHANGIL